MPLTAYRTPGVYVEEVPAGARPITALGTSTAGFLGLSPKADAKVNEAVPINNFGHFVREFVEGAGEDASKNNLLAAAVFGFFQNGGRRCYVCNVGASGGNPNRIFGGSRRGIEVFEQIEEISLVAAPGCTEASDYETLLSHCEKLKYRVCLLDPPLDVPKIDSLKEVKTGAVPSASSPGDDSDGGGKGGPAKPQKKTRGSPRDGGLKPRQSEKGLGAFYFPWIYMKDPLSPKDTIAVPPSGHIAGICARVDSARGVHKAPANEPINGAINLTYRMTQEEQGGLNDAGVNCIRFFGEEGIRVWGARTLAGASSEWRYLNVRRLFCMIEQSIERGTRWCVFEPNDETLWRAIRRDVSAFLTLCWRDGALMGAAPEEAFFVQCDAETNPPEVIDQGMVVIRVGIAPVKPAEFIIFKISQYAGSSPTEIGGE